MYKLKYIALHITNKCTHSCSYCYYCGDTSSSFDLNIRADFPLQKLKAIIDEIVKNEVNEIFLLGGDPADHMYFLDLVKYAYEKGLVLTSVSNTHEYEGGLAQVAKYVKIFDTTIHGVSNEAHDKFCGIKGAYEKVLNNLALLKSLGCSTGITINITPLNSNEIYQTVKTIINSYGEILDYVNVQRIAPYGKASINKDYFLSRKNLLNALVEIDKIKNEFYIEIQCEDSFPLCLIPKKYWKYVHRCEWGYEKLSINGDGNVSRCSADPRYNLGNVLDVSLKQIWNNSPILEIFRSKDFLYEKCKKCLILEKCGGGCVLGAWVDSDLGNDRLLNIL